MCTVCVLCTCRQRTRSHFNVGVVVRPGERVSIELLKAAAVPVVGTVKIHADIFYEPRNDVRVRPTRRYIPHAAAARRTTAAGAAAAAGAEETLLVSAQRQRRIESAVASPVPHRHDARLAVARPRPVDQNHVGRTPAGSHAHLQTHVRQRAVVAVRQHAERGDVVVVEQCRLDAASTLVHRRPVHRRPADPRPHRPVVASADVHRVPASVAVADCRRTGVQLTPSNFVDAAFSSVVATPLYVINHTGN